MMEHLTMFFLILGLIFIIASPFLARMGCMGTGLPVGCTSFMLGVFFILRYLYLSNIITFKIF